jgi:hypothetical protein
VLGVLLSVAVLARRQHLTIVPSLRPSPHFEVHQHSA